MDKETKKKLEDMLKEIEEDFECEVNYFTIVNSIIDNFKDEKPIINIFIGDDFNV